MAINIPSDVKPIRDQRLNLVHVVGALFKHLCGDDDSIKSKVKSTMKEKSAKYAESDLVVAELRGGAGGKSSVNVQAARELFASKKLTTDDLLACATISKKSLAKHLNEDEIESVTTYGIGGEPALYTDLQPGVALDLDEVAMDLAKLLSRRCQ